MFLSLSIGTSIGTPDRGFYTPNLMKTMGDRIRERLKELEKSQHWLAREVGIRQPSLNVVINGADGESTKHVVRIAQRLGLNPTWMEFGTGQKLAESQREAVLVGDIGAAEKVVRIPEGTVVAGGLEPPAGYDRALAARIKGNSMRPLKPNWLVFYEAEYQGDPAQHVGKLCAVGLEDGTTYIKELKRRNGRFVLESWTAGVDPITDAKVVWASPILEIRPR